MLRFYIVCLTKKGQFINVNSDVPVQKSQTEVVPDHDLHCSYLNEA